MNLLELVALKKAAVGVLGLGHAGLPLAVEIAEAGYPVTGFDIKPETVDRINHGLSPVTHVPVTRVAALVETGALSATTGVAGFQCRTSARMTSPFSPGM